MTNSRTDSRTDALFLEAKKKLKEFFGFDSFRPKQEEVIRHVLNGKDTLALMPTGGGKSICYQIPSLVFDGCTIVISPLIALMKDQVDSLRDAGIAAAALNSGNSEGESTKIRMDFISGKLKLLYISPERLTIEIEGLLTRGRVSLFAIDEAHCISQWGHDFRPEYTQLFRLRDRFPKIPVLALTATADSITRKDILQQLRIPDENLVLDSFDRKNLSLSVRLNYTQKNKIAEIAEFIDERKLESGIVYCLSRKSTEKLASELAKFGIRAKAYHAGLTADERAGIQEDFIYDRVKVICATIAFGMGIDKSNIRYIIHYNVPKNMEGFYQEIGRAGRDSLPADTLMFYSDSDIVQLAKFIQEIEDRNQRELQMDKLRRMEHYAKSLVCRRRILLGYFGEILKNDCGNCDICRHPPQRFNGTIVAQKALSAIARTQESEGYAMIVDILRGSHRAELLNKGYDKLKTFGAGASTQAEKWHAYIQQLIHLGCITMSYTGAKTLHITEFGKEVLFGKRQIELALVKDEMLNTKSRSTKESQANARKQISATTRAYGREDLTGQDAELFERLRELRLQFAQDMKMPPYIIFSDKVLMGMVLQRPENLAEMSCIPGIGAVKLEKYGVYFLQVITDYLEELNERFNGN